MFIIIKEKFKSLEKFLNNLVPSIIIYDIILFYNKKVKRKTVLRKINKFKLIFVYPFTFFITSS